jgi:predicted TIM-barrel fold metal-dependent hydrolase
VRVVTEMLIDIHVHTTPRRTLPYPGSDQCFATPWELIEMYDFAGIARGVLLPCTNPENVHTIQSNEEILDVWQRYPDRFIPFCNIDPRQCFNTPDADLGYMLAYYKDLGCRGIGEVCANLPFDDPRVENLFDHVEKNGLPLTFHVATRDHGTYGLIDGLGLPRFEQQIIKHPNLVWLCHSQAWWSHVSGDVTEDTWGGYPSGPVTEGGRVVELMRKYPNVCGDLSAGSGYNAVSRDPEFGYWFLTEFQNQLCFGTDVCAPKNRTNVLVNLRNFLNEAVAANKISQQVYDKVTHLNAQRILGL